MKMYSDLSNAIDKAKNTGNTEDIVKAILDWSTVNTSNNRNPNTAGVGEAADKDADTINILNAAARQLGISFSYDNEGSLSDNLASFRQAMIPQNPDSLPTLRPGTVIAAGTIVVAAGVTTIYLINGNWYKAAVISVTQRALTSADLGIDPSKLTQLKGTFEIVEGRAIASVDMIEGNLGFVNPTKIIDNLVALAKSQGASSIRIQGTIANERLLNILSQRYQFVTTNATGGYTEYLEIVIP
jgi:hypothetical protein